LDFLGSGAPTIARFEGLLKVVCAVDVEDDRKQAQWKAFLRKDRLASPDLKLRTVTEVIAEFLSTHA